jgi:ribosome assembly protein 1
MGHACRPALQVKMCLVINKIDRLVLEVGMSAAEAAERLRAIVARVNGIVSAFTSEKYISDADAVLAAQEGPEARCAL